MTVNELIPNIYIRGILTFILIFIVSTIAYKKKN